MSSLVKKALGWGKSLALAGAVYAGGVLGNYESKAQTFEDITIVNRNTSHDDLMARLGAIQSGDWFTFLNGGHEFSPERALRITSNFEDHGNNFGPEDVLLDVPSDAEMVAARELSITGAYTFASSGEKLERDHRQFISMIQPGPNHEITEGRLYQRVVGGLGQSSMPNSGITVKIDESLPGNDYFMRVETLSDFYEGGHDITLPDGSTTKVYGLPWKKTWMLNPSGVSDLDLPDEINTSRIFPVPDGQQIDFAEFELWGEEKLFARDITVDIPRDIPFTGSLVVSSFNNLEARLGVSRNPENGGFTMNQKDLTFTYDPDDGFEGVDSFRFYINDEMDRGLVDGSPQHFATITLNVGNGSGGGSPSTNSPPYYTGDGKMFVSQTTGKGFAYFARGAFLEDEDLQGLEEIPSFVKRHPRHGVLNIFNVSNGSVEGVSDVTMGWTYEPNGAFREDDFVLGFTDGKATRFQEFDVELFRDHAPKIIDAKFDREKGEFVLDVAHFKYGIPGGDHFVSISSSKDMRNWKREEKGVIWIYPPTTIGFTHFNMDHKWTWRGIKIPGNLNENVFFKADFLIDSTPHIIEDPQIP